MPPSFARPSPSIHLSYFPNNPTIQTLLECLQVGPKGLEQKFALIVEKTINRQVCHTLYVQ